MLLASGQWNFSTNYVEKAKRFITFENGIEATSDTKIELKPTFQRKYDTSEWLADRNGVRPSFTATDMFSHYLFAVPLKNFDSLSVDKTSMNLLKQHVFLPCDVCRDKISAFTS